MKNAGKSRIKKNESKNIRERAFDSLMKITEEGAFSSSVMEAAYALNPQLSDRDRALYAILVEGTLDHLLFIDFCLDRVSGTPVKKMRPVMRTLLRMSAFQILFLDRVPDHAVVSEAMNIAEKKHFGSLKSFVNGVLHGLIRQRDADELCLPQREEEPLRYLSLTYSCPEWIVRMWTERFGTDQTEEMLLSFRAHAKLCLWVNPQETTAEELTDYLKDCGIEVSAHPQLSGVLLCSGLTGIGTDEAFEKGAYYVQDFSSILACLPALYELAKKDASSEAPLNVIDVCGAPGGKSLYLAAHLPQSVRISCRDVSEKKAALIRQNADRMHLSNVQAAVQDARICAQEDEETADLLIADVPCSGLGVIGRKADLRYRVKESDIDALCALQRQILSTVQRYVKPGGLLVYSTCTISGKENEDQVKWVLENLPFETVPLRGLPEEIAAVSETPAEGYLQIWPSGKPPRDGFFVAMFRKKEGS